MAAEIVVSIGENHEVSSPEDGEGGAAVNFLLAADSRPEADLGAYIIPPNRNRAFLDGTLQLLEPAAPRSLRLPIAMNVRDLVAEGQGEESLTMIKQLARAEVLEPYRLQRIAKDGRMVDVWLTATTLVNATGEAYALATTERTRRQQDDHDA